MVNKMRVKDDERALKFAEGTGKLPVCYLERETLSEITFVTKERHISL